MQNTSCIWQAIVLTLLSRPPCTICSIEDTANTRCARCLLVEEAPNNHQAICPEVGEGEGVELAPHADACPELGEEAQREAHHCTRQRRQVRPMPNNIAGSSAVLQMHSSLMGTNGITQLSS